MYLILEYIPGQSLDVQSLAEYTLERRNHFYSQLINSLAQMRQLKFPCAGSLRPNPSGGSNPVVGPMLSIHINEMEAQGSNVATPLAAFASVTQFNQHQLRIMTKAYRLPMSEQSLETAQLEIFALKHLERELTEPFQTYRDDSCFVLSHLDLRWLNVMVDGDLNILAIIDWEWASSVPRSLFMPPSWIAGCEPRFVTGNEYRAEYGLFYDVLLARVDVSDAHRQLA